MAKTSAQLKLAWGIEHVDSLRAEAILFEHSEAYLPDVRRLVRSPTEVEYVVTAVGRKAPPEDWPLLAGDAIHNLRSALDHAVSALAPRRFRGTSQFPIFKKASDFEAHGQAMIRGLPETTRALIENAQPYQLMPGRPELHPLAFLNRLSNFDKHRTLSTVAAAVRFQYVGLRGGIHTDPLLPFHEGRELQHRVTVAHVIARSDREIRATDVDPQFQYEVRSRDGPSSAHSFPSRSECSNA